MLRAVVLQTLVVSAAVGLVAGGVLLLSGHSREALGMLFGSVIGISNQAMVANRISRIGAWGSARETRIMLRMGTAMRFLMIGMAALVVVKLHATVSIATMLVGVLVPIIVANIVGARFLLRPDL